jgi:hypothetical protein
MVDDRWAVYDRFSDKGAYLAEWFKIMKNLLKLAYAGDRREAKCPCNMCQNRRMLFKYGISEHILNHGFMPNYLM